MQIYDLPGPKAKAIIERDSAVISPSYARAYPFVMDHGKGSDVWDVDGNHFLDFAAGIAVTATGHSHPKVVQAIKDQSEKFLHISADFYHEAWVNLGERLDQIAPFKEDAVSFHDQFRHRKCGSCHQAGALSYRCKSIHWISGGISWPDPGIIELHCQQTFIS